MMGLMDWDVWVNQGHGRLAGGQNGQTLVFFALVAAFLLFALLSLVGDYAITLSHYNAIDEAAVLGAQAGAAQIDVSAFVDRGLVVINQPLAVGECERIVRADASFVTPGNISCIATADYVEARVKDHGQLVVRLLGDQFNVSATHRSRPAYGTTVPCSGPCP